MKQKNSTFTQTPLQVNMIYAIGERGLDLMEKERSNRQ